MLKGLINVFLIYSIVRKLTKPFKDWDAFKTGVIDDEGNILISKDQRTADQKDSLSLFDVLIMNMKKLLAKIPGGSSRFASYTAALFLLREENTDMETFKEFINEAVRHETDEYHMMMLDDVLEPLARKNSSLPGAEKFLSLLDRLPKTAEKLSVWYDSNILPILKRHEFPQKNRMDTVRGDIIRAWKKVDEDTTAPTNSVGGGHIAGTTDGPVIFAGSRVFDVDHDSMVKSRFGKKPRHRYRKYVGDGEVGEAIREYARNNPKKDVVLRNKNTGEMIFLRRRDQ